MKSKLILLLLSSLGRNKPKRETSDRGFTLIEVIVAIVVLSIFILTSLTALVAGLNLKLKAKLNNEATLLIQQDLELVRYVAANTIPPLGGRGTISNTLPTALIVNGAITVNLPLSGNNTLSTSSANDPLKVGTDTTGYRLKTVPTSTASSLAVTVDVTKTTTATTLSGTISQSSITVASPANFTVGRRFLIGSSTSSTVFVGTVSSITGNTITFSPNNTNAYANGTAVTVLPSSGNVDAICPGTGSTIATSSITELSNVSLKDNLPPFSTPVISPNPNPIPSTTTATPPQPVITTVTRVKFNDRAYEIRRRATPAPDPTFNNVSKSRVQLAYQVIDKAVESSSPILAELTTEVIPNVTFQCP